MALPVYTYDSIPSDAEFNAFLRPVFNRDEGQEEFPGSLLRLRDTSLSNDPTQLKPRWETFERTLQVTAGAGLTANYQGGSVTLPSGLSAVLAPGAIAVVNNAVSFVYVNTSGAVETAASLPVISIPLAQITTVAGAITQVIDLRPRFAIQPISAAIKCFGGTGDQGNYTLSGSATFDQGEYYFRNFTINNTATLNVSRAVKIFCSGTCTIAGTVIVSAATTGGSMGFVAGNTTAPVGRVTGGGIGGGSGNPGRTYNFVASPVGSGGSSGIIYPTGLSGDLAYPPQGGDGGGAFLVEAAGNIVVSGSIQVAGTPAVTTSIGVAMGNPRIAGAGGGSGGLISLRSLSSIVISNTAILDVRGGNGSDGHGPNDASNNAACGGCGGGGGQTLLIAPSVNTTGATILLTGGNAGANRSGTPFYGGGAGGSFGGSGGNPGVFPYNISGSAGLLTIRNFRAVG
jgi:hypothetical protein